MKALLITPVEDGSGETITAIHMAENLIARRHSVLFLASPFASSLIRRHFPNDVWQFGKNGGQNCRTWEAALQKFRPDVVVFADYPLMFFPVGTSPLTSEPGWVESLDNIDVCLVTLDHFGFAQDEMGLFLGPPHLSLQYQKFPAIPQRMQILLPCPMHEPSPIPGRRGHPFRYWSVPLGVPEALRQDIRRRYLDREDDLLVFHSVPNWAWRQAELLGLPFYQFLPQILDYYFGDLPKQVTVVSVNNGNLLLQSPRCRVRLVNLAPMPKPKFEALLFSSDLAITENKVSISMGKAVCGLQPCAILKNSYRLTELIDRIDGSLREVVLAMESIRLGTVYPYEVFPTGMTEELKEIVLYRENSLAAAFSECEIYGGEETADALRRLLTDPQTRENLRGRQLAYVEKLQELSDSAQVLSHLVEGHRRES